MPNTVTNAAPEMAQHLTRNAASQGTEMEIIHTAAEAVEIIMAGRTLINDFLRMWKQSGHDGASGPSDALSGVARYVVVDSNGRALSISVDDRFFLSRAAQGIVALQFPDSESARFALEQIEDQRPEDGPMTVRTLGEYMLSVARFEASEARVQEARGGARDEPGEVRFITQEEMQTAGADEAEGAQGDECADGQFETLMELEAQEVTEVDRPRG